MRKTRILLTVVALVLSACSSPTETATTKPPGETPTPSQVQRQPEGATSFFAIAEIGLDPEGWVALENFTSVPVTLDGLALCQAEACFELPDIAVGAGERAYVTGGDSAPGDGVVVTDATIGDLKPSNGEIALFVSEGGELDSIIAYLEWGSTPHVYTDAAIEKGLWLEGAFAPSGENAVRLYRVEESGLWLWESSS